MSARTEISGAFQSPHATGVLYASILGAVLGDIIPTPADAVYFLYERKLRIKLIDKTITPAQYWERTAFAYYILNPIWWLLVFLVTIAIKGDAKKKMSVMFAMIGAGAVIGVLARNIKKDNELLYPSSNLPPNPNKVTF